METTAEAAAENGPGRWLAGTGGGNCPRIRTAPVDREDRPETAGAGGRVNSF